MNNYVKVKVEGKNVNNYIRWLIKQKINVINIDIKKSNEMYIIIDYKHYKLLGKYSKTYKLTIVKMYGKRKIILIIKNNKIILICFIISVIFLYALSNVIFSVEVVYNNQNVINNIEKELAKYNIKKYKLKKDYSYLDQVKKDILKNNKDSLEWLEIIENGTKYIIKLVERKKEQLKNEYEYQSIIATKDAVITNIKANSGEKIKQINQYVKKGETILSGIIVKPDGTKIYTKASGTVCGEVWYKVEVEYPYFYYEEILTGKSKKILTIYFLNKRIPFFPYYKYKHFQTNSNDLIINKYIPLKVVKEKTYETIIVEEIYNHEEVILKAKELVSKKLIDNNENIIKINQIEILNEDTFHSKIRLKLFVSVEENITKIVEIKE